MTGPEAVWLVLGGGVVAYALTGGADFGGGIWHLFARGEHREREERAIERAIAPIWEANHVWVIFVIVLLFTAFPHAFAVISTALHVPISLALVGIVTRGSAFVFHSYHPDRARRGRSFALAFGLSSLLTPFVLGDLLGAVSTGDIRWDGVQVTSGFFSGWTTPFAVATGGFAVVLFLLLAAVYLTADSDEPTAETFRHRALGMEAVALCLAMLVFALARTGAPILYARLLSSAWTWPVQVATAGAAGATILLLVRRRFRVARLTVAVQTALVIFGWGMAMSPNIVIPDVTIETAAARAAATTLLPLLAAGCAVLGPSLWYLYRVFKAGSSEAS